MEYQITCLISEFNIIFRNADKNCILKYLQIYLVTVNNFRKPQSIGLWNIMIAFSLLDYNTNSDNGISNQMSDQ